VKLTDIDEFVTIVDYRGSALSRKISSLTAKWEIYTLQSVIEGREVRTRCDENDTYWRNMLRYIGVSLIVLE
jgi:hypothetical protein